MNSGLLACISGTPTNTCVAGMAGGSDTTCNNQDDNCDGTKDEGYAFHVSPDREAREAA